MYEQYEPMDESGYARPHLQAKQDVSSSRIPKKPPRWVFISRKADIVIILILLLVSGLGVMWFISQLPFLLETASGYYIWAKGMCATWGTPSMRLLFINLVVGVIVATSGLLSAFGGDGVEETRREGYDKDRIYGSSHPTSYNESASETRFSGAGYESPAYNPYLEPTKTELHHETSFGAWNYGTESEIREREHESQKYEPPIPEARGVPLAGTSREKQREIPISGEIPVSCEIPISGEILTSGKVAKSGEIVEAVEIPLSMEIPISREISMPREIPVQTEMPLQREIPVSMDLPAPEYVVERDVSEAIASRGKEAIEIISKVYDPIPEPHVAPADDASPESSPPRPELLPKSHTFTIGRVIRRDQLVDFIEPLSRKLEVIGRKVRPDPVRSLNAEPTREISAPHIEVSSNTPVKQIVRVEAAQPLSLPEVVTHRRRHSAESVVPGIHYRKSSFESVPPTEVNHTPLLKQTQTSAAITLGWPSPPPSPPLLRQRSIVYPPALLSQSSIRDEDASPPPSPPMEVAIPPPPPPHLKLPPPVQANDSSSIISREDLPSFKFYAPTSTSLDITPAEGSIARPLEKTLSEEKQPLSKHARSLPAHIHSMPALTIGDPETSSASILGELSPMVKHHVLSAGNEEIEEVSEGSAADRSESSSAKNDDLHQQIDDFLARFHENWRLQRQESLARYKKRLVELDD